MDHLSDAFVDVFAPLNAMVEVATEGDRQKLDTAAEHFQQHAHTMLKVCGVAATCTLRYIAWQQHADTLLKVHTKYLKPAWQRRIFLV